MVVRDHHGQETWKHMAIMEPGEDCRGRAARPHIVMDALDGVGTSNKFEKQFNVLPHSLKGAKKETP